MLRLRFGDYARASRSHTLSSPTAATAVILAAVRGLLAQAMPVIDDRGVTLLGVSVSNLDGDGDARQLTLPFDGPGGGSALDDVLDHVRYRFGSAAVTRATLLGSDRDEDGLPPARPG